MKPVLIFFVSLLITLAACSKPAPAALPANALRFPAFAVDVVPAFEGKTRMRLGVRFFDAAGRPAPGRVEGQFVMPAMGAMAEMRSTVGPREGEAAYDLPVELDMAGKWFLTLRVAAAVGEAELRYAVNTLTQDFSLERTDPPLAAAGATATTEAAGSGGFGGGAAGGLYVPEARRQLIGVTYAPAEERDLAKTVRAFGRVALNEQSLAAVNLQVGGWARQVFVKDAGTRVREGDPLMTLYSPELAAAQQELLIAAGSGDADLVAAARAKLRALGMDAGQIGAVERRGRADDELLVRAPRTGYVVEKNVVDGARVEAGMTAFRIGNLGRVWVLADVFESDAGGVAVGQRAVVRLPGAPAGVEARVGYVYPTVDERTRTLPVRLEITNPAEALKPGMVADVYIDVPLGRALTIPRSAVLASGEHRYVFVDLGGGYLEPREVQTAGGDDEYVRVTRGLRAGERVSTSANFLLSSEAQLQNALPKWGAPAAPQEGARRAPMAPAHQHGAGHD